MRTVHYRPELYYVVSGRKAQLACSCMKTFDTKELALKKGDECVDFYLARAFVTSAREDFKTELSEWISP